LYASVDEQEDLPDTASDVDLEEPLLAATAPRSQHEHECCVCQEAHGEFNVLLCNRTTGPPHATCIGCLNGLASALSDADGGNLGVNGGAEAAGKLRCPFRGAIGARGAAGCDAEAWDLNDQAIVKLLTQETVVKVTTSAIAAVKQLAMTNERQRAELARRAAEGFDGPGSTLQSRLETEARQTATDRAERLRKMRLHILDEVVNLRCPRCKTVFLDYEGCDALTCGVAGCGCAFCALCLKDCGNDAHPHVREADHHGDGRWELRTI
jgi:hypothetical protein